MVKPKLTLENVFDNLIAKSIIWILGYFVDNIGLEQKHLRFLLMEEYATQEQINNDVQLARNIEKIKNFFNQNRKQDRYFGKGLVKSRAHLNYYLDKLSKPPLELIEKKSSKINHKYSPTTEINKYFLTTKGIGELARKINIKKLYSYNNNTIVSFYEKMVEEKYKGVDYNQVFYGITNEERKALSEIDKKTLNKYRKIISVCLLEMENILRKENSNRIHNLAFVQIFKSSNITKEIDF